MLNPGHCAEHFYRPAHVRLIHRTTQCLVYQFSDTSSSKWTRKATAYRSRIVNYIRHIKALAFQNQNHSQITHNIHINHVLDKFKEQYVTNPHQLLNRGLKTDDNEAHDFLINFSLKLSRKWFYIYCAVTLLKFAYIER